METNEPSARVDSAPLKILALIVVTAGIIAWLSFTPDGLLGKADAVGYAVCHRIDVRSFHIGERALPLCVRCTGMFAGALLGLIYQAVIGVPPSGGPRRSGYPRRGVWALMALFFVAFGVDGVNSYLHLFPGFSGLYTPHHALRLATGLGMGLSLALAVYPAFRQTVYRRRDPQPVLRGGRDLAGLLLIAIALGALIWTQSVIVLYPLALFSALGVLGLLTLVYTMVAVMILRIENRLETPAQLVLPLILGVGMAFFQIAALDFLRYLLTGTWNGFNFG